MKLFSKFVLGVLLIGLLSGCGANNMETDGPTSVVNAGDVAIKDSALTSTPTPTQKVELSPLAKLVEYFKSNKLEVGETKMKAFDMMGAVDGFGILINGKEIELYLFDPSKANDETKKKLEDAQSIGKFNMSGISFPVIMNGNIMLTRYDEHPDKDKIVGLFRAYK